MKNIFKLTAAALAVTLCCSATQAAETVDLNEALQAAQKAAEAAARAEQAAQQAQQAARAAQARADAAQAALAKAESERAAAEQRAVAAEAAAAAAVPAAAAEGESEGAVLADAGWKPTFDFHGYFRAGVGKSRNGANMEWQKSKLGRLGNESDTYGELEFGSEFYRVGGVSFYLDSMISAVSDGDKDSETLNDDDDVTFGLRQFNLQIKGLIPGAPDAVIWAGKRFYQRHDLHIIDCKYWNISGSGAGIEYLPIGPGTLSAAWLRADSQNVDYRYDDTEDAYDEELIEAHKLSTVNVNYVDLRYAGFRPWKGAWTEFGVDVAIPDNVDAPASVGGYGDGWDNYDNGTSWMFTAELSQDMFGGYNKTVLQYFTAALAHNALDIGGGWYDSWTDNEDGWGISVINTGEIPITNRLSINHVLHYGYAADHNDGNYVDYAQSFRAVARLGYQTSDYTRIMTELAMFVDKTNYTNGSSPDLLRGQKATLAFAIAPEAGLMSRPELRIYASYLHCSDGEQIPSADWDDGMYETQWNFGVQAEAWW